MFSRRNVHPHVQFKCNSPDCGKQFQTRNALELHHSVTGHSGTEVLERKKTTKVGTKSGASSSSSSKLECGECEKEFASKGILETHVAAVHRDQKPYKCEECEKEFPYVSSYKSK